MGTSASVDENDILRMVGAGDTLALVDNDILRPVAVVGVDDDILGQVVVLHVHNQNYVYGYAFSCSYDHAVSCAHNHDQNQCQNRSPSDNPRSNHGKCLSVLNEKNRISFALVLGQRTKVLPFSPSSEEA